MASKLNRYIIQKYVYSDSPIPMTKGAKVVSAGKLKGQIYIFALESQDEAEKEIRKFLLLPTGTVSIAPEPHENVKFVGSVQHSNEGFEYMWHVFEVINSENEVGRV